MTRVCRALVFWTLALLRQRWHGKDSRFLARLAEKVWHDLIFCTLALLRPHWHGKDNRFLARLAEQSSASDFTRNDKGLPRSRFLYLGAAAAALARQGQQIPRSPRRAKLGFGLRSE